MRHAMAGSVSVWRITRRGLSALCAGLFAAGGIGASFAADIELGRYLSTECITCHGSAHKHSQIPDIFGHAEGTFEQVLKAYRDKRLENQVMQTVASRLNDEEIAALAAYFARTKRPH